MSFNNWHAELLVELLPSFLLLSDKIQLRRRTLLVYYSRLIKLMTCLVVGQRFISHSLAIHLHLADKIIGVIDVGALLLMDVTRAVLVLFIMCVTVAHEAAEVGPRIIYQLFCASTLVE